jgi:hypothetical protein
MGQSSGAGRVPNGHLSLGSASLSGTRPLPARVFSRLHALETFARLAQELASCGLRGSAVEAPVQPPGKPPTGDCACTPAGDALRRVVCSPECVHRRSQASPDPPFPPDHDCCGRCHHKRAAHLMHDPLRLCLYVLPASATAHLDRERPAAALAREAPHQVGDPFERSHRPKTGQLVGWASRTARQDVVTLSPVSRKRTRIVPMRPLAMSSHCLPWSWALRGLLAQT